MNTVGIEKDLKNSENINMDNIKKVKKLFLI